MAGFLEMPTAASGPSVLATRTRAAVDALTQEDLAVLKSLIGHRVGVAIALLTVLGEQEPAEARALIGVLEERMRTDPAAKAREILDAIKRGPA